MKSGLDSLHRTLSKSRAITRLCAKLRNQANCVIAYHLGESADPTQNGEFAVLDLLAPQCATFVDVGANIGNWSDRFLQYSSAEGHAFEPSPQCAARLRSRFLNQRLTVHNIAVSDNVGTALFAQEPDCGEGSSLTLSHGDETDHIRVNVTTLDHHFDAAETRIDFLKVDTEGYDLKVLKGAYSLLSRKRIRFLQFEYNSCWLNAGSTLNEAIRILTTLGYTIYLIKSSGLHHLRYSLWGDYFAYSNYFACRPQDIHLIRPLLSFDI